MRADRSTKIFDIPVALAALALVTVSGCASTTGPRVDSAEVEAERELQQQYALENLLAYQRQIDQGMYPIVTRSYELCGDKITLDPGVRFASNFSFAHEYREKTTARFGIDDYLRVVNVIPGSPAESAGFQVGDRLLAVNGKQPASARYAYKSYRKMLREAYKRQQPLRYELRRGEDNIVVTSEALVACDYGIFAKLDVQPNAYATGSEVVVHSGLMNFLQDERQLAFIVGHELAHNVSGHRTKSLARNVLGTAADVALPTFGLASATLDTVFSPGLEAEADYIGMYFVARAGIDITNAEEIWRRMSAQMAGTTRGRFFRTHPTTPERFVKLRHTVQEIQAKIAAGQDLRPER